MAGDDDGMESPGKPYSPACERNRDPILAVLREHFAGRQHVLEIGSGTGQHAVHFAAAMPWLVWQASDRAENLPGIQAWLDDAGLSNTPPALALDVMAAWPAITTDAVFTANTLHIMDRTAVQAFFAGCGRLLAGVPGGTLVAYGPFNQGGTFSSDSNRDFDAWLKARDPDSGIRDSEWVDALARAAGLVLVADAAMPANNRCRVWRRAPSNDA